MHFQSQHPSMTPKLGQQSPVKPKALHLLFAAHFAPEGDFVVALASSDEYHFSLPLMLLSPEIFGGPYRLPKLHNISTYA